MTDEELKQEVQSLAEEIERLSKAEKLTGKEKRRKHILQLQKLTLERLAEARVNNDKRQEASHAMNYGMLTYLGDKHPILMMLARAKMGGPHL